MGEGEGGGWEVPPLLHGEPLSHTRHFVLLLLLLRWDGGFQASGSSQDDSRQLLLICSQRSTEEMEEDEGEEGMKRSLSPCLKSIQMRNAVQPQQGQKDV